MEYRKRPLNVLKLTLAFFIVWHSAILLLCIKFVPLTPFYVQNIVGVVFFGILLLQFRRVQRSVENGVFVTVLHVWAQAFAGFLCVGGNAGFDLYFFGTLCASFFLLYSASGVRHKKSRKPIVVEVFSIALFALMRILSGFLEPWYVIEPALLTVIFKVNATFILSVLLAFAAVYRFTLSQSLQVLQNAAQRDELTGLLNRRGLRPFLDTCDWDWRRHRQYYALAIFDIDDFKRINDTYGHDSGDVVIRTISKFLEQRFSSGCAVCRWGGEEFLVVSQISSGLSVFYECLEEVIEKVRKHEFKFAGTPVFVTVTCGAAVVDNDMPVHELVARADHRLYIGKNSGKNQLVVAD